MEHIIDKIMKPKQFEKDLEQRNRLYWFWELLEVKKEINDILRPIEEDKRIRELDLIINK
jgi:hypothetical protein